MADFLPRTFYVFCAHSAAKVAASLDMLVQEKARISAGGDATVRKLYEYAEPIREKMARAGSSAVVPLLDQATAKFLDAELVDAFVKNPADREIRGKLALELLFVSAGVGTLPGEAPYTPAELQALDRREVGDDALYEKVATAYTFRHMLQAPNASEYLPFLMAQLHLDSGNAGQALYDWESALLFALLLHAIWKHMAILPREEQTYVLQNYFYLSVACGIPVKIILESLVREEADKKAQEEANAFLLNSLEKNHETVPTDLVKEEGRPFTEIMQKYTAIATRETAGGFGQETFFNDLYANQPGRDTYMLWLRDAMTIIMAIRRKTWVQS